MTKKYLVHQTGPSLVAAAIALAFGTSAVESAGAENFYGLSVAKETSQSTEQGKGGVPGQDVLDQVFDAAEAQARSRLEKTRDPELMRRGAGKSPAEAAVEAQRRTFKDRAERSMFGEAPPISNQSGRSVADKPEASVQGNQIRSTSENRVEALPDGRVRIHTRLGKFGPEAAIVTDPVVIRPRAPNPVVRYTESGIPVSARRDRIVKKSQEIANRYFAERQRKIDAGEMEPPPKVKTQAEIWEEQNAEILARRKKHGRETSKNFVIAGTTPEQSKLYYRDSTYVTFVDGKAVPVVDAPQEKLPKGWLSKDEYEKAKRKPDVKPEVEVTYQTVKNLERTEGSDVVVRSEPSPEAIVNTLSDLNGRDSDDGSALIRGFFPDAVDTGEGNAGKKSSTGNGAGESGAGRGTAIDIRDAFPDSHRTAPIRRQSELKSSMLDRFVSSVSSVSFASIVSFAFGVNTAHASEISEISVSENEPLFDPSEQNKAITAFEDIAKEIERDYRSVRAKVNAVHDERKRIATETDVEAHSCGQCSLDGAQAAKWAEDFALETKRSQRASKDFYGLDDPEANTGIEHQTSEELALFNTALSIPEEMRTLEEGEGDASTRKARKELDEIVSLVGDPEQPGAILSVLREGLVENPVVLDYVPDAAERLGLLTPEEEEALADPLGNMTYVFISFSLGDEELKELFARNAGKDDTALVLRGIPDGMTFGEGVKHVQGLAAQFDPMPNVVIDPTLFRDFQIKAVPTVIRVREKKSVVQVRKPGMKRTDTAELLGKATGLHSDVWIKSQLEAGRKGDFGQQGEVREIEERDLIEVAKERVLRIDWEEKKEKAAKRAWANLQYENLPTASKSVVRMIDPTILVEEDILDLNGNAIRRAGDRVNPMDIRPLTLALIVFNPLVESELKVVEAELPKLKKEHPEVMLLATDMVKDETGWDAYTRLTDRLDSHVYLLTPEVRERFLLRATPSVVTGDNERKLFVVREIAPEVSSAEQGWEES